MTDLETDGSELLVWRLARERNRGWSRLWILVSFGGRGEGEGDEVARYSTTLTT